MLSMFLKKNLEVLYIFLMTNFVHVCVKTVLFKLSKIGKMEFTLRFAKSVDANLILRWKMQNSENIFRGLMDQNWLTTGIRKLNVLTVLLKK